MASQNWNCPSQTGHPSTQLNIGLCIELFPRRLLFPHETLVLSSTKKTFFFHYSLIIMLQTTCKSLQPNISFNQEAAAKRYQTVRNLLLEQTVRNVSGPLNVNRSTRLNYHMTKTGTKTGRHWSKHLPSRFHFGMKLFFTFNSHRGVLIMKSTVIFLLVMILYGTISSQVG